MYPRCYPFFEPNRCINCLFIRELGTKMEALAFMILPSRRAIIETFPAQTGTQSDLQGRTFDQILILITTNRKR